MEAEAKRVPHFGLRKLSVGVASVLLSTTLYFGVTAHAATNVPEGSSSGVSQDTHTSSPYSASEVKLGSVAGTVDGNVNSASEVNENVNKAGNDSVGSAVNNSVSVNGNDSANSSVGSTVDASVDSSANGSANKTVDNSVNSSANSSPSTSVNDVANDNLVTTTFNTLMDHSSRIDPAMLTQSLRLAEVSQKVPYHDGTVGVNDAFNRYVSRTINITLPDGTKKDPITQTIHFVRKDAQGNAGTRNNDGTVSFVPWTVADSPSESLGHFVAVNLPKLAGYAAVDKLSSSEVDSVNSQVVAQVVLPYMVNSTVNVEYKALGTNMPVYVIDDNLGNDAVIIDASVSGTPGQKVPLNIKLPAGYQLKAGQTIPTTVTIDPNNTTPLRIHVTEKVVTVTYDHPVNNGDAVPDTNNEVEYISGMSQSDLNHTVNRKVIVSKPDGTSQTIDGGSVTFTRDAEYNLVTGQVTYTSWSNDGKKTLPAVVVDDVPGYITHRDQAAGDLVVTPYNQQVTGKVTFVPINEATTIRFIDVEDNGSDGEPMEVGSYQINGETGTSFIQTSDDLQQALTDSGLDAYFVLDDPTAMVSGTYGPDKEYNVKLKHRHVILSHNNLNRGTWTLPDGEPVPPNVGESSVYKTIRRTINVEVPSVNGQGIIREPDSIDQVATFAQDIDVDMGKLYNNVDPNDAMTYEGWNLDSAAGSDHFASYTPPVINGYTPSVSSVPAEVVTQDSNADDVINITYTASDQTGKISYVDAIGGEEVGHTDLTGKTNEAVTIKPVAPTGWKISDGQNIPSTVIATANGVPTVTVKVEHIITPVSHNNPIPVGGKTTTGVAINGAHDSDLNQTITRTINVTDPSGHKTTTTQEAKISQDAKYDEVTGEVTYDGNWSQDSTHWNEVDVPTVDGYAPSVATVPALTVKHGQQNVTIDIDYTANSHSTKINFIDNQGHVISSVTVDGKTGETKQLGSGYHADVPTGWTLDGSEIPTEIVFGSDGHADYNLNVKHAIHHVTHDQAVPADGETVTGAKVQGAHESDLNKTIVRTITETAPDGHTVAHATRTQTAHVYRDADYDEVTGEVSYGTWSKDDTNWAAVTPDAIDGYTTNIDGVPGTTVPAVSVDGNQLPVTVKVTYSADHHVMHIFFEDDNGDKITPDGLGTNYPGIEVSGNTDTTARLGTDYEAPVPTGWELEADQQVPKEVSFGANGHGDVVVKIKHHLVHFTHDQPVADGTTTSTGQSIDGAFTDDLNQTIVRTITTIGPANHPVAQPKIVQKAQLFQDGYYDDVTGEVTTNDWSQATWDAVTPEAIPGYTAHIKINGQEASSIPRVVVKNGQQDVDVEVTYTADTHTMHINFEDDQDNKISSVEVTGDTDETKTNGTDYHANVPTGWVLESGQSVPASVTFGANGHADVTVKIKHGTVSFTHDKPVPEGTKTPTGTPVDGGHESDLNKTITRTIMETAPAGHPVAHSNITQTAHLYRNGSYDTVTGHVTYDNWSEDSSNWAAVTPDVIDGYTAHIMTDGRTTDDIPAVTVQDGQKNVDVAVTYTANQQIMKIVYVDGTSLEPVKTYTFNGLTDQTIDVDAPVPAGWELVSGQSVPTKVTFGADSAQTTVIKVQPQERSVTVKFVDDQYFKQQVGQAITVTGRDGDTVDLKLTVPDKYQLADGQQLPTTYTFTKGSGDVTIHLVHKVVQREAAIDIKLFLETVIHVASNGYDSLNITQTRWKQLEEQFGDKIKYGPGGPDTFYIMLPSVEAGALTGHVSYDLVDNRVVSLGDDWTSLNLDGHTYQLPNGTEVVNGVMLDDEHSWGKKFKEEILKHHPDVDPDYANRPWHGYLSVNATNNSDNMNDMRQLGLQAGLAGDEPNALAKAIGDRAATAVEMSNKPIDLKLVQDYDFDFSEQNGQLRADVGLPVGGFYIPYVEKTATRTINVTTPDGKTTAVKQTATLAKQVDFSEGAHPAWTTDEWASYDAPIIPGYTASQSNVAKETVTGTTKDQIVNITYTANSQTTTVVYQTKDGTPVHTTTVTGKTGQTVMVPNEVPTGWYIVNGEVPSELTFGPDGAPKTVVTIDHSHVTVTPDAPKTTGNKLPDNPDKAYPTGVSETDLNKTITRTIKVTTPDEQTKTSVQIAKLTRTADIDEVTGEVKYSDWTTGEWASYDTPTIPGYTPTIATVNAQTVRDGQKPVTVNISYTANDQTMTIHYVNEYGTTVQDYQVSGKTDQTVDTNAPIPAGWELLGGQTPAPATITFKRTKTDDITVKIKHHQVSVTADNPVPDGKKNDAGKLIDGAHENDLNQTITRTIKVTDPHSGKVTTTTQTAKISRNATYDDVTGEVTTDAWSQSTWDAVTPKTVPGYTAHIMTDGRTTDDIPAVTVMNGQKDVNVEVTYTANDHSMHIYYQDQAGHNITPDGRGTDGTGITVSGKTGQTVDTHAAIPTGWVLASGQQDAPAQVTFDTDGHADIIIKIKHGTKTFTHQDPIPDNGRTPTDQPIDGGHESDLNQTITRTITETAPAGHTVAHSSTTQTAKIFRDGSYDTVTGHVTYGNWSEDSSDWTAVTPDVIDGYTTHIKVDGQDADSIPAVTVKDGQKDVNVKVAYTANDQQTTVDYVINGHTIKQETLSGVTDSQVPVNISLPDGYSEVAGQTIPKTYTFKAKNNQPVVVQLVKNQELTINYIDLQAHNQVKTQTVDGVTGQIVNMPSVELPAGYRLAEGQDIPKTFTLNDTGNNSLDIVVTPILVRVTADQPKASGTEIPDANGAEFPEGLTQSDLNKTVTRTIKVNYPDNRIDTVDQTVHFVRDAVVNAATGDVAYGAWQVSGKDSFEAYTPKIVDGFKANTVASQVVTADTKNSMVQVIYTQIPQAKAPLFIDANGVGYDKVPAGYHVADGQLISKGSRLIVKDVHVTVPPVTIVTRTINMTMPNGKTLKIVQKAVKGNSNFSAVRLPHLRGYQLKIDGQAATNFLVASAQADGNVTINVVFSK